MPLFLNESLVLWVILGYGSACRCRLLKVQRHYLVEAHVGRTEMKHEMKMTTWMSNLVYVSLKYFL